MDERDKRIKTIDAALWVHNKEPYGKEVNDEEEGEDKRESMEVVKKGEAEEKSAPPMDPWVNRIEHLLKESCKFNYYFNDYAGFTTIPKGILPPKFTILDTKSHETEKLIIV